MQITAEGLTDEEIIYRPAPQPEGSTFGSGGWSTRALHAIPIDRYPSGEPLVRWADISEHGIGRLLVRQRNMDAFMTAMFLVDALADRGFAAPDLILPFVPGARQDRLNPEGDYLFTIKTVAGLINARNFPSVTVLDPHSEVTPALIDRCRVITAAHCIMAGLKNFPAATEIWSAVLSPDAGSEKRAGLVAMALGLPVVYGWKSRDVATGKLNGFGLQQIPVEYHDRPLLLVDDICDAGGTFLGMADQIEAQGCTADLYVTHGIFSKGTDELLKRYRRIFTTDTIIANRPGVNVLPTCATLI